MPTLPAGLAGTWLMTRAVSNGEDSSHLADLKVLLKLSERSYSVSFFGEVADRGNITAAVPGALELHGIAGSNQGRTIPCIYQLAGDLLRICYGLDGVAPTTFTAPAGSAHYLVTYRRAQRT